MVLLLLTGTVGARGDGPGQEMKSGRCGGAWGAIGVPVRTLVCVYTMNGFEK